MPAVIANPQTATSSAVTTTPGAVQPTVPTTPALRVTDQLVVVLARHSITALRISLGIVFFGFGVLKFFPWRQPGRRSGREDRQHPDSRPRARPRGDRDDRGHGMLHRPDAAHREAVKIGLAVLGLALIGILSPLVLFPTELFPHGTPMLTAQYVIKDIVLAAAGLVVAAKAEGPASSRRHARRDSQERGSQVAPLARDRR